MVVGSGIKAIVFDIDGTLCSLSKEVGAVYAEVLARHNLIMDPEVLNQAARAEWQYFQELYLNTANHYHTSHEREKNVWLEFVRRVLVRAKFAVEDQADLMHAIYNAFASAAYRSVEPGAIEFLQKAKGRGLHSVAASNNDQRSKVALQELGLAEHLEGVFVAGDLTWKKPSPFFFETLAQRLKLKPEHILHVGNNLELDVEAAQRCGWSAILYDPRGRGGEQLSVRSFAELAGLLGI